MAGVALAIGFIPFMTSGLTFEAFADPGQGLKFATANAGRLRLMTAFFIIAVAFAAVFLAGLAAKLRDKTPTRATATLYLGLLGLAGHALGALIFWAAIPSIVARAATDQVAASHAWVALVAMDNAADGFGMLFVALSTLMAGWAVITSKVLSAAEHLLAKVFVKPGDVVLMNYHFTTTKAHMELAGATVLEIYTDEALNTQSVEPFRGNLDVQKFREAIERYGPEHIPFVRMEATTNLIGGQPFSLRNLREVREVAVDYHIPLVFDGSLLSENAYFIKRREPGYADRSIREIIAEMMNQVDILYLSGRKSTSVRGGLMATNSKEYYDRILAWLPVYEGFATYGGMSTKEIEAMAVGLREMTELDVAGAAPEFVQHFVGRLQDQGVPVVTPPGGLACHVDARRFLPHLPQAEYPAGALAAAIYLASGIRSMERGTISMDRDTQGREVYADLELARLAVPRRVYTLSHIEYAVDRLTWLHQHRDLVKGLRFVEEPKVLRFFFGRLEPLQDWGTKLAEAFAADFGPSH